MVTSLRLLAENTLIRDIIFSKEVSPLLYQSYLSTDHLKFETRFIFNGKVLNFDESVGLPYPLSNQIVLSLCEFCPKFSPEWAYLHLIHSGISQLALSNLTVADIPLVQILSLLYKLFARCQRITELYFEMVEITSGFVTHCLMPRAEQYTTICLSSCLNVQDVDVTMLLKNCSNLTNLNVSGCMISDAAFSNVHLPKIQCNYCGNKRHKSLKLTVLNIAGCVKLTTKTIRKIVELSGPSLRCLYLNQCVNIYTTALWYLCGLFKGKEEFFRGNFALDTPLSCFCDIEFSVRVTHKKSLGVHEHEDCNGRVETNDDIIEKATASNSVFETNTTSTSECTSHKEEVSVAGEVGDTTDVITQQVSELNLEDDDVQINPSPEHQMNYTLGPCPDNTLTCNTPSDGMSLILEQSTQSSDTFEETFRSTWSLCAEQCAFLEAFLHHTADEGPSQQTSSSRDQDVVTDNLEGIIDSSHSFEECKYSLCLHFHLINKDALISRRNLIKIIEQSYNDVDISGHEMYQHAAKSVIVSARQILLILDQMVQIKSNQNEDQENCNANNADLDEVSLLLSDEQFLGIIPVFRDKLLHFVSVIGKVQKEIKRNELLRLRLLHSLELEALQREELVKIRTLHDQLSALHDDHEAIFGGFNLVNRDTDGILQVADQSIDINTVNIERKFNLSDNIDFVLDDSSCDSDVIHDDEVYDENSPELVNLLKSEAKLLLQHARYSHCPSCCPNAYTPQLEELDISDIKYQSEELAVLTLKGFLTVNKGLKRLNMSWACIDNSLMEFVAASCPDLKALSVQQCTQLSTPFLESFSGHNLMVLDTLGVSWLHDSDILSLLQPGASSLTSLCLAESNITDIGLVHLAKSSKLRSLNLSWCDEVTDTGLSVIISSHSAILQTLLIRQCSIGHGTLKAIAKCSKLEQLDISTNLDVTDELWTPIALGLPLLVELDISWVYGMTDSKLMQLFYHCPRLKKLTIDGHKQITTCIFRKMITTLPTGGRIRSAQYAPRLQFISLQYCNDIDDDELWEIVQQCKGSLTVKNYYGDEIEYTPPTPSSP